MIYCSIDLMKGKAVQLVQGKAENKQLEVADVRGLAVKFAHIGPINVIDLDAALGCGDNRQLIFELAKEFRVQVGGGIRTVEIANAYFVAGVQKMIIGSKAMDRTFLSELIAAVPKEKIIIALDSFGDEIVINGWQNKTQVRAADMIAGLEPFCSAFLFTQVEREGLMQGPDFERLLKLASLTRHPLIAAGGISSIEDIAKLARANISSVLGMALYTGKIDFNALLNLQCMLSELKNKN